MISAEKPLGKCPHDRSRNYIELVQDLVFDNTLLSSDAILLGYIFPYKSG